jgi:hypothetical protein
MGALRDLLAHDVLGAFGQIGLSGEQADEGELAHRLVGELRLVGRGEWDIRNRRLGEHPLEDHV